MERSTSTLENTPLYAAVVKHLIENPLDSAAQVSIATGCALHEAQKVIDQRSTPIETLMKEVQAKKNKEVWPLEHGFKADAGKLPYHLLPPDAVEEILKVLEFGANKYAPRNWEKGMAWSRPFSALMRHMWAWWRGENADPETGLSHLAHAGCCILFLLGYELRKIGEDDRP